MNEQLDRIVNHPQRMPALVGLVAFAGGVGIGYILGRRNKYEATVELETVPVETHDDPNQMRIEFDAEQLAEELAEVREHIQELREQPKRLSHEIPVYETNPETGKLELVGYENEKTKEVRPAVEDFVAQKLKEAMMDHQMPDPEPEEEAAVSNVFARTDDNWDYREEQLKRSSSAPYILHKDEFYADELGYTQMTLTYYEGDNILVDEEDCPIYNHGQVVGELKWGHGCEDPNVVHIRNDKRKAEYEVLRHEGLYSTEVLGLEIENNQRARDLKHSSDRKFRLTE
jgi:hypothetical protein